MVTRLRVLNDCFPCGPALQHGVAYALGRRHGEHQRLEYGDDSQGMAGAELSCSSQTHASRFVCFTSGTSTSYIVHTPALCTTSIVAFVSDKAPSSKGLLLLLQGILSYAGNTGSVNFYMAHGGTNFGFWAGTGSYKSCCFIYIKLLCVHTDESLSPLACSSVICQLRHLSPACRRKCGRRVHGAR